MLGAVSNSRALTIGLPLLLVFGAQFGSMVPILAKIMPWNLVMDVRGNPSLAMALIKGQPLTTVTPIICTAGDDRPVHRGRNLAVFDEKNFNLFRGCPKRPLSTFTVTVHPP